MRTARVQRPARNRTASWGETLSAVTAECTLNCASVGVGGRKTATTHEGQPFSQCYEIRYCPRILWGAFGLRHCASEL